MLHSFILELQWEIGPLGDVGPDVGEGGHPGHEAVQPLEREQHVRVRHTQHVHQLQIFRSLTLIVWGGGELC